MLSQLVKNFFKKPKIYLRLRIDAVVWLLVFQGVCKGRLKIRKNKKYKKNELNADDER